MNHCALAGVGLVPPLPVRAWQREVPGVLAVVANHFPLARRHAELTPPRSWAHARQVAMDLRHAAPRLAVWADHLARVRDTAGCGAFAPTVGLATWPEDVRARVMFALSLCLGLPTGADVHGQVVWNVRPRPTAAHYFATFSEHSGEAAYHTDTQYMPMPEASFLLYVMSAAGCGGGESRVRDARQLRAWMEVPHRRWALEMLQTRPLPFRVPSAFQTDADPNVVQATLAPVWSTAPHVRYRADTLQAGIAAFPEWMDPDLQRALTLFEEGLVQAPGAAAFHVPSDGLLLVHNHQALHARSAFSDRSRHLLRIRLRVDGDEGTPRQPVPMLSGRKREASASWV